MPTTAQTVFSQPFEIKANRNVRITANAPVSNSWADLDVDLVNEQNNEVESVDIPIEYYSGVDGGESWSEGGQVEDATLSALPAGKYTLRLRRNVAKFSTADARYRQSRAKCDARRKFLAGVYFAGDSSVLEFVPQTFV